MGKWVKKLLLYITLMVTIVTTTAPAMALTIEEVENLERLPLEKNIPAEVLRNVGEYLGEVEEVERALLGIQYDEEITSFGGGYPSYSFGEFDLDELYASDGKDILPIMEFMGYLFVSYTKSGKPIGAFVMNEKGIVQLGLRARPVVEGVSALCAAHRGDRKIAAVANGLIFFDITDERKYVVYQSNAALSVGLDWSDDLSEVPYYNEVIPMAGYVGYMQQLFLAETSSDREGRASGFSLNSGFQPYTPLAGEPVYTDQRLPYLIGGLLLFLSGSLFVISKQRKAKEKNNIL